MARSSQTNPSPNGEEKPEIIPVATLYSTPTEGADIASMFARAHKAVGIGHRTFSNVPFPRPYSEGDTMTAAQAAFLSTQVIRASLGNEDYDSVEDAANVAIRDIPAQYSLLEDAADNVVLRLMESLNAATGRRVDREATVASFLSAKPSQKIKGSEQTVASAISQEIASLINARKAVKGKATEIAKANVAGSLLEPDEA